MDAADAAVRFAAFKMDYEQHTSKQQTNASHHNVRKTQERILAAEDGGGGQDEFLCAVKFNYRV